MPATVQLGVQREAELKKLMRKYLLQRLKTNVLSEQLLGKDDIIVFCELTPLQVMQYPHA